MYRNNGVNIAIRLLALREFLYDNADETHAIRFEDIRIFYFEKQFKIKNEDEEKGRKNNKMIYSDLHALQMIGVEIEPHNTTRLFTYEDLIGHQIMIKRPRAHTRVRSYLIFAIIPDLLSSLFFLELDKRSGVRCLKSKNRLKHRF